MDTFDLTVIFPSNFIVILLRLQSLPPFKRTLLYGTLRLVHKLGYGFVSCIAGLGNLVDQEIVKRETEGLSLVVHPFMMRGIVCSDYMPGDLYTGNQFSFAYRTFNTHNNLSY
jgi:hypothetical protein